MKKKLKLSELKVKSFMTSESAEIKGGDKGTPVDIGTNAPRYTENERECLEPASQQCYTNQGYQGEPMCLPYTKGDQGACTGNFGCGWK